MNRYVIVSFVQKEFPLKFGKLDWPLHVTVVRPFSSDRSREECMHALATICSPMRPIHTLGKSRAMFGHNDGVPVTELENTPPLQALHDQVVHTFEPWMEPGTPDYATYRPHATDQTTGKISVEEEVVIDSVSLVELRGEEREVVGTITFQE